MTPSRLAIVTTHPIQYYAPVFRTLSADGVVLPRVFYTWSQAATGAVFDPGFGKSHSWDIPLLDGYDHEVVANEARSPGAGFFGIRTPELTRRIESWGADAVLVFGWNNASHLSAMRYFRGRCPVYFRGDSTLLDPATPVRRLLRQGLLRWVYRHVDVALAVGENSRDYFRYAGLPDERIVIVPHSVDTDRFSNAGDAEADAARRRRDLGIAHDAVVIVFAGKLQSKKAPDLLLSAVERLGGAAHVVFVGDGELEGALRAQAKGSDYAHFLPFQNQSAMPWVYRLGDLFVLPSRGPGETWGLALNEAMACGRAVMASDRVGGARDLIVEGATGWTFSADDVDSLHSKLLQAVQLGRPGLGEMGARGRERVVRWSTSEAARGIAEAVVGRRPPRRF